MKPIVYTVRSPRASEKRLLKVLASTRIVTTFTRPSGSIAVARHGTNRTTVKQIANRLGRKQA